ncbi:peptide-methionine (S)-S-oxide reductase [uncultured Gelidibacter sp.]|uniref:peptide-methionine (S)-S-oxide reductase n=1 Tax=uncultured Gelidibacter sp. TaxID=259318 RepID=UPI00262036EB|nr:peptide-methionine (S)-S-oxide reductase [uncultured Gelidibacter sp.]
MILDKIGFGGGCHWCTEAVFQALKGVEKVEQGYIASTGENSNLSEAVIVHFNRKCINLITLIEIHLLTHNSTSNHSMRKKYRSAVYTFNEEQHHVVAAMLQDFQYQFNNQVITQTLPFHDFEPSREEITNYYIKNPEAPFCETYINPKLKLLLQQFSGFVDPHKMVHLKA